MKIRGRIVRLNPLGVGLLQDVKQGSTYSFLFKDIQGYRGQSLSKGEEVSFQRGRSQTAKSIKLLARRNKSFKLLGMQLPF